MSQPGEILTLTHPVSAELTVKGSRFIARVQRIASETEAKQAVSALWDAHPGARHVCFAYRLGPDGDIYRAYDDGEPGGSAGLPILNRLRSHALSNCLASVVRYFGGTKLGVPGLIAAYSDSVEMALANAEKTVETPTAFLTLHYDHGLIGQVDRWVAQRRLSVVQRDFGTDVRISLKVGLQQLPDVEADLARLAGVTYLKDQGPV
jgi:uncharacterized YigZ family protein